MQATIYLGINIDHVATVRQARGTQYPDPIEAALLAEAAGADGITLHLREDRRHIQDRDVEILKGMLQTRMNLEMALTEEMLTIAEKIQPQHCALVPERREELTTEGGLNVRDQISTIHAANQRLSEKGIEVSLFIDPVIKQIDAALDCAVPAIEIHTGCYADAANPEEQAKELTRVKEAVDYAKQAGLIVNAGHGLHYHNTGPIAAILAINELNIGHAIIARALMTGMTEAVRTMKQLMVQARQQGWIEQNAKTQ